MLEEGTQETCRRDFLGVRGRKRKRGKNLKSRRTLSLFLILHLCSSNKKTPNCMSGTRAHIGERNVLLFNSVVQVPCLDQFIVAGIKKKPAFHGIQRLVIMFTKALPWTLFSVS
jgi:hypothetical protein